MNTEGHFCDNCWCEQEHSCLCGWCAVEEAELEAMFERERNDQ